MDRHERRNLAVGVVVGLAIGGAFGFVGSIALGTEPRRSSRPFVWHFWVRLPG